MFNHSWPNSLSPMILFTFAWLMQGKRRADTIFSLKVPLILSRMIHRRRIKLWRAWEHEWVLRLNTLGTNVTARRALGSTSGWAGVFSVWTCWHVLPLSACVPSGYSCYLAVFALLVVFAVSTCSFHLYRYLLNISYFALICGLSSQKGRSIIFSTSNKRLTMLQDDQWGVIGGRTKALWRDLKSRLSWGVSIKVFVQPWIIICTSFLTIFHS